MAKNVKVLSEREILASLVAVKRYSTAEMIRRENEKKKTKAKTTAKLQTPITQ